MAVDDAELLALAGGDSSDEEGSSQQPSTHRNANSPLPSIEVSQAAGNRSAAGQDKVSPVPKQRSISGRAKPTRKHESEEEGEA